MTDPIETAELVAFSRIVESLSLSRAAAELGVPRATVSRRLARLEERLGARLLRRTTRRLSLTDAGEAFYRHARLVLDAVSAAEASVRRVDDVVRGDLRVSVPPILTHGFHVMICEFARRYPEVRLQIQYTTRRVDLQRDGYDVALRAGPDLEPGLVARTLARDSLVTVASPGYLERHGHPRSVKDLKQHRCLLGFARGELPEAYWPLLDGGKLHVEGNLVSNEVTLLAEAARGGLGIALLPALFVRPLLESGELVRVLPAQLGVAASIAVVYLEREFVPPQIRAFVDFLASWVHREFATGQAAYEQLLSVRTAPEPAGGHGSKKTARARASRGRRK